MNKSLVLVMCDVLVLSAMSLSNGGFDEDEGKGSRAGLVDVTKAFQATSNEVRRLENALKAAESNANKFKSEADKAKGEADKAKGEADKFKSEADKAKGEADKAKSEADKAKGEADKAKSEADKAKGEADKAKSEADKAKSESDRFKSEADKAKGEAAKLMAALKETERKLEESERSVEQNIDVIEHMLCRVTVTTDEHKDEAPFYSPIIDIKGEAYVMVAGYDGKHLDKMKSILVGWAKGGEEPRSYPKPDAYYLDDGGRELDIVLLKLQGGNMWTNRMTLGKRTGALPSYWCGKTSGNVRFVQAVPVINWDKSKKIWSNYNRGDMCVDVKKRSICGLYVSIIDDPFVFDDPNPKLRKWPFEEEKGKK